MIGPMSRRVTIALLIIAGWTLVALYFAIQAYYNPAFMPRVPWSHALKVNFTYYYLWALCTPIVIFLGRRFRFDAGRWTVSLLVHLAASAALTLVQIVVAEAFLSVLTGVQRPGSFTEQMSFAFGVNFQSSLPTYWLMLFLYLAIDYYAKFREREIRTLQLETQLSQATLQALKMQLNPHFLFNALNSISSLMYTDVESADAMLARLSEFLRMTVDRDLAQEIPLEQELDFVRRYLEIEQIRFEERLHVSIEADEQAQRATVPSLALQPLVENAIHHGIAPRPQGGAIEIRAYRENAHLHLSVMDDGVGAPAQPRERIGLANTRARLERLYGEDQRLSITDMPNGGFRVDMVIPYRLEATS